MASSSRRIGTGTWIILAVLLMLLALAVHMLVTGWSSAGEPGSDISAARYVAMALGVIFTLALGIGLMALIFYSNRRQ